jgi:hypothetical protein
MSSATAVRRVWLIRLGCAAALATAACGSYDGRPRDWEYIAPVILRPNCATVSCHSRAAAVSGLDFSDPTRGYTSLTRLRFEIVDRHATGDECMPSQGTVVCRGAYRPLITPYDPAQSRLVHLLRERTPPRMPPDRPLVEADIRLIEEWILLGARQHAAAPASMPALLPARPALDGGPNAGLAPDAAPDARDGAANDSAGTTLKD